MKSLQRPLLFLCGCLAALSLGMDDTYADSPQNPFGEAAYPDGIQVNSVQVTLIKQVVVPAEEAGVIDTALVKEGDLVKEGEMLARINDAEAQLNRRKAQLEMEIAALRAKNDVNIRYARNRRKCWLRNTNVRKMRSP